jgi:hypothetical protein
MDSGVLVQFCQTLSQSLLEKTVCLVGAALEEQKRHGVVDLETASTTGADIELNSLNPVECRNVSASDQNRLCSSPRLFLLQVRDVDVRA